MIKIRQFIFSLFFASAAFSMDNSSNYSFTVSPKGKDVLVLELSKPAAHLSSTLWDFISSHDFQEQKEIPLPGVLSNTNAIQKVFAALKGKVSKPGTMFYENALASAEDPQAAADLIRYLDVEFEDEVEIEVEKITDLTHWIKVKFPKESPFYYLHAQGQAQEKWNAKRDIPALDDAFLIPLLNEGASETCDWHKKFIKLFFTYSQKKSLKIVPKSNHIDELTGTVSTIQAACDLGFESIAHQSCIATARWLLKRKSIFESLDWHQIKPLLQTLETVYDHSLEGKTNAPTLVSMINLLKIKKNSLIKEALEYQSVIISSKKIGKTLSTDQKTLISEGNSIFSGRHLITLQSYAPTKENRAPTTRTLQILDTKTEETIWSNSGEINLFKYYNDIILWQTEVSPNQSPILHIFDLKNEKKYEYPHIKGTMLENGNIWLLQSPEPFTSEQFWSHDYLAERFTENPFELARTKILVFDTKVDDSKFTEAMPSSKNLVWTTPSVPNVDIIQWERQVRSNLAKKQSKWFYEHKKVIAANNNFKVTAVKYNRHYFVQKNIELIVKNKQRLDQYQGFLGPHQPSYSNIIFLTYLFKHCRNAEGALVLQKVLELDHKAWDELPEQIKNKYKLDLQKIRIYPKEISSTHAPTSLQNVGPLSSLFGSGLRVIQK